MTGWRVGYGVMRADLAAHITKLIKQLPLLHGKLHAEGLHRSAEGRPGPGREDARRVRAAQPILPDGLNGIKGFPLPHAQRGVYVFPNISRTG